MRAEWVRQVAEAAGQVADGAGARAHRPGWGLRPAPGQSGRDGREGGGARDRVGRERWRLTGRRYVASFGSAATFGPLAYQVAVEAGVAQAELLVVLGDGASWISEIASWHFPTAERRLDLWHLLRRGAGRGTAGGGGPGALGGGRACPGAGAAAPEGAGVVFAGYLANQREWIVAAEMLLAQGEIVGSGAIEKGVDLVLNRRFKGRRGMRWWRANANAIVTLRTHILNHQAEAA